jgi:hypothetical protein
MPIRASLKYHEVSPCPLVQRMFESHPRSPLCASDFNAGIGVAEMLGQSNYLAIVGGGKNPKFPQNKVRLL